MKLETLTSAPPVLIEKEKILHVSFPKYDVLSDASERAQRLRHIERAALLGNGYQCKVHVVFLTADNSVQVVYTTLWEADSQYITLKSGALIPVTAILRVVF